MWHTSSQWNISLIYQGIWECFCFSDAHITLSCLESRHDGWAAMVILWPRGYKHEEKSKIITEMWVFILTGHQTSTSSHLYPDFWLYEMNPTYFLLFIINCIPLRNINSPCCSEIQGIWESSYYMRELQQLWQKDSRARMEMNMEERRVEGWGRRMQRASWE